MQHFPSDGSENGVSKQSGARKENEPRKRRRRHKKAKTWLLLPDPVLAFGRESKTGKGSVDRLNVDLAAWTRAYSCGSRLRHNR